jgi:type IV secretion system protein VirD4
MGAAAVPSANQGHSLNDAVILLIAHFVWDFWPAKFAAVGVLAYVAWLGLGAARDALTPATRPTSHGEARTATRQELWRAKLIPRRLGIYLGYFVDQGRIKEQVGYDGNTHLLTIGPAGSGKGMGLIVPNLASLQQSVFVIDPKGEAAAITARARARFSRVMIINPFNVLADERPYLRSHGFNPLGDLQPGDNFTDDAANIALALVKEQAGSNAAFFSGSARDLLTALIMYEKIERGEKASLANVRRLLTEPYGVDKDSVPYGLARTIFDMSESRYTPLRSKAARFRKDTRSNSDVIATAANETQFLDSPPLQRDLQGMTFDWDMMKRELTTVYLILPADRLETHANYLRLVVTSALRSLLRTPPSTTLPPVLFILDEFAQLGYLPPIENAIAIARGFGVQLWPILQDLNQLKAIYKDRWETFIGNTAALTAFAPQDLFTAEYLSKLCGQKTEVVKSGSESLSSGGGGINYTPQGFPLFRPENLMQMPPWQMLVRIRGRAEFPFFARVPGYWETPFAKGLDPNPYHPT